MQPEIRKRAGMAVYKNHDFFDLLERSAGFALKAAKKLEEMTGGITPEEQAAAMNKARQDANRHMQTIRDNLEAAFITPMDKDDIYKIAKKTDDITGSICTASDKMWMMNITRISVPMKNMAAYIVDACEKLAALMAEIKDNKKKNRTGGKAAEIDEVKRMGGRCFKVAIRELFMKERDPVELIRSKEIYEGLNSALLSCGCAADCVRAILATKT